MAQEETIVIGGLRGQVSPKTCKVVTTSEWPIAIIGMYLTVEELKKIWPDGYEGETIDSTDLIWVRLKRYNEMEIERNDMRQLPLPDTEEGA